MKDLIEKLEAAEGWSQILDNEIGEYVGAKPTTEGIHKKYTTSLDAALTLVPDGWHTALSGADDAWGVRLEHMNEREQIGLAPTPALALCIAAIKARDDDS